MKTDTVLSVSSTSVAFRPQRTRIKICGLTRANDIAAAVAVGADALGFVFYEKSPRYVTAAEAAALVREIPPFVMTVGLFVNASVAEVAAVCAQVPLQLLQFHGDESPADCMAIAQAVQRPFIRAARVQPELDLLEYQAQYTAAQALLLDAHVTGYGGGGKVFDWSLIPEKLAPQAVLSGGLNVQNVATAIKQVRPYAVDVSSGVESAKGIKDHQLIQQFVAAVRQAEQ
ncbi:phosphoribosylanthranilate isomerase [Parvibium lacunae]|uniref:N-(5'-phosphoribosyl)anthranilate isomerase n=1 Tax=Parvibium lacunae TaxID=1888893 RepID=A0A368L8E0_9BURK|nr:phosphoribosylanthranilate isomerase [Parvibium lacunae]RCS59822.1 phosphoribosylanthranilate isomerase [Parvibium lacunae]